MSAFHFSTEQTLPERRVNSNFTIFENVLLDFQITIRDRRNGSILAEIRLQNAAIVFLHDLVIQFIANQLRNKQFTNELEINKSILTLPSPSVPLLIEDKKDDDESSSSSLSISQIDESSSEHLLQVIGSEPISQEDKNFIDFTSRGLPLHDPELCEEGVSSVYFLRDENDKIVAVFKPLDEEDPKNNPKSMIRGERTSPRKGIQIGEAAQRERAAYLLDKENFFCVPPTYMVKFSHPSFHKNSNGIKSKIGSLQKFIDNECSAEEISFSRFPVKEVHKIGILDIQIINTDRHSGNILVKRDENGDYRLVPIDHALSLPDTLDEAWFDWLHSPQAKKPFDSDTLSYIERIDINKDIETLERELSIRPQCLRNMRITTTLLKKGAKAGRNLYQIANMICRTDIDNPSILENMCQNAKLEAEKYPQENGEECFFKCLENLMDEEFKNK